MLNLKKYFPLLVVFLYAMQHSILYAQETDILTQKLEKYASKHLEEKLFLHTDKSVYLADEICWFKIYHVDGFFHLPLSLSTIAYIEILDSHSKPVVQEKVDLQNGQGSGSLKLPNSVTSGHYTLRAYTNWMKNYSSDFFFQKNITIINTLNEQGALSNIQVQDEIKIQLFPEGGNLVNDISNKVGFKIINQYGKGVDANGFVLNEKSDTILKVSTLSHGMGNFNFKPSAGHTYKFAVQLLNNKFISEVFPTSINKGYSLRVLNTENKFDSVTLLIESKNISSPVAYIISHTRGVVKIFKQINLVNGIASYTIPKTSLSDGINCFALFDENRIPVCERLVFKYPTDYMGLTVSIDAKEYTHRNKVSLKLNSFLLSGKPTSADLSMAVYKIDDLQSIDETNIQNYLWLSSDLIGKVESPNSYFNTSNPNRFEAIDNLMLTNGWRRFNWENVLNEHKPSFEFIPEIAGKIVTGRVIPTNNTFPISGITAFLSMPSKRTQFHSSLSDKNGRIKFQFADFYNDDQVIAQIEKNNASNYHIEIETPFAKSNQKTSISLQSFNREEKNQINQYHRDLQVQNYYNQFYVNKFEIPIADTNAFYHSADNTYLLDDYSRFTTLEEVFREYISPIKLTKSNGNFDISVYDNVRKRYFSTQPLILLDGYPISDLNKFMNYDPLKLRKIEIVDRVYFLGNMTYYGILNFTTYNGKMETYDLDPQAIVLDYKGLQSQREFMTPDYSIKDQTYSRTPDFRHLLYWSDAISTNLFGKNDLSFFTSDVPGKYVIVVQGMNKDGKIGYQEMTFEVKGQ
ncbi:MAG: hypothetical protein WCJ80_05635 [Bacteroidota bacterium]